MTEKDRPDRTIAVYGCGITITRDGQVPVHFSNKKLETLGNGDLMRGTERAVVRDERIGFIVHTLTEQWDLDDGQQLTERARWKAVSDEELQLEADHLREISQVPADPFELNRYNELH